MDSRDSYWPVISDESVVIAQFGRCDRKFEVASYVRTVSAEKSEKLGPATQDSAKLFKETLELAIDATESVCCEFSAVQTKSVVLMTLYGFVGHRYRRRKST
jgi:hypothetical protein